MHYRSLISDLRPEIKPKGQHMFLVGDSVAAEVRLYETYPDGRQRLVARPGDRGFVAYVSPETGLPLVRFERTGWAVDCNRNEVSHA